MNKCTLNAKLGPHICSAALNVSLDSTSNYVESKLLPKTRMLN